MSSKPAVNKEPSSVTEQRRVDAKRQGRNAAKPQPKKMEEDGLRMEGVASGYAHAREHEILFQTTRSPGIATDRLREKRRSKPAQATQSHHKATPKPPQSHILSIDSGVQRHPKATPRLPQGYPKAC